MREGIVATIEAGAMTSMAYAPDSKAIATANADKSIRLWDVVSAKEVRKFETAKEEIGRLAFAADGKRLASVGSKEPVLRVWDVTTGKEVRQVQGPRGPVTTLALSPDGKLLATGSADGRVRLWDLAKPVPDVPPSAVPLTAKELEEHYGDLTNADPVKARRAFGTLLANPKQSVPFLKERVRSAALVPPNPKVNKLIADLDADDFEVRDRATEELAKLGQSAAPALRQALTGEPSEEVRKRVTMLLAKFKDAASLSPDKVVALEAIDVLEQLGTPEARAALAALERESLDAPILQEVRAALRRAAK
jgi:hypothetical protein